MISNALVDGSIDGLNPNSLLEPVFRAQGPLAKLRVRHYENGLGCSIAVGKYRQVNFNKTLFGKDGNDFVSALSVELSHAIRSAVYPKELFEMADVELVTMAEDMACLKQVFGARWIYPNPTKEVLNSGKALTLFKLYPY
jgi:hypothetical protein